MKYFPYSEDFFKAHPLISIAPEIEMDKKGHFFKLWFISG